MEDRREKSWWRKFFFSRAFLVTAFVFIGLVVFAYGRALYHDYQIKKEIETLDADIRKLEGKNLESMEILRYVTSLDFVEEKARTELNFKKPGENAAIVKEGEQKDFNLKKETTGESKRISNPIKWLYYFLHKPLPEME